MRSIDDRSCLCMLTTTTVPYVYHIPAILSLPSGIPYWFRYQNIWLEKELGSARDNDLRNVSGVLYMRDNESLTGLCFPLRRFRVMWNENRGLVSFFYVDLGALIAYGAVPFEGEGGTLTAHEATCKVSWSNVQAEIRARLKEGVGLTRLHSVAVPLAGQPSVLTETQLRSIHDSHDGVSRPQAESQPVDTSTYVWRDSRGMFRPQREGCGDGKSQNERWVEQMGLFALVSKLRAVNFWRILGLQDLHRRSRQHVPKRISRSDEQGFYTHGYSLLCDRYYAVEVCQIIPKLFAQQAFDMPGFELQIAESDPGIEPISGSETIDGLYGRYELSFGVVRRQSGNLALVRVKSTQELGTGKADGPPSEKGANPPGLRGGRSLDGGTPACSGVAIGHRVHTTPPSVLPVRIRERWLMRALCGALSVICIGLFVFYPTLYRVLAGDEPGEVTSGVLKAVFFGLSLYLVRVAGPKGVVQSLSRSRS